MKYRHYKGGLYETVTTAQDEATQEEVMVYKSLETGIVWVRNAHDFYGDVTIMDEESGIVNIVRRFQVV